MFAGVVPVIVPRKRSGSAPESLKGISSSASDSSGTDEESSPRGPECSSRAGLGLRHTIITFKKEAERSQYVAARGLAVPLRPAGARDGDAAARFSPRAVEYQKLVESAGYHLGERLNCGAFAEAYVLVNWFTGDRFAGKFYSRAPPRCPTGSPRNAAAEINHAALVDMHRQREMQVMTKLTCANSPNVTPLVDYFSVGIASNPEIWCTVTNLAEAGDLLTFMDRRKRLTENQCRAITRGIFVALAGMHGQRVVHSDVKLENVLIEDAENPGKLMLGDFGLSAFTDDQDPRVPLLDRKPALAGPAKNNYYPVLRGTLEYAAPEVISRQMLVYESDVWSAAVTSVAALLGFNPFYVRQRQRKVGVGETIGFSLQQADLSGTRLAHSAALFELPDLLRKCGASPAAQRFFSSVLRERPEERPSAEECLTHDWLSEV
jgi:serine/threonine protein kinase